MSFLMWQHLGCQTQLLHALRDTRVLMCNLKTVYRPPCVPPCLHSVLHFGTACNSGIRFIWNEHFSRLLSFYFPKASSQQDYLLTCLVWPSCHVNKTHREASHFVFSAFMSTCRQRCILSRLRNRQLSVFLYSAGR